MEEPYRYCVDLVSGESQEAEILEQKSDNYRYLEIIYVR